MSAKEIIEALSVPGEMPALALRALVREGRVQVCRGREGCRITEAGRLALSAGEGIAPGGPP